jgi:hypothetical protein
MSDQTQAGDAANEAAGTDEGDQRVMGLLSEHVPLSLLVDLADPEGPASDEILQSEGMPEDAWWVQEGVDLTAADEKPADEDAAPGDDA